MKKLGMALVCGLVLGTSISAQVRTEIATSLTNNATSRVTRTRIVKAATAPAKAEAALPLAKSVASTADQASTQTYRVGVGDVLDIQIADSPSTKSTLYTVTAEGLVDYPLVSGTVPVVGVTTQVVAARLKANIKVLNNPEVQVSVRDYTSHTVRVIGFVGSPGEKVLRREAVPLYVVLSQSLPLAEAASVTITRKGTPPIEVDLHDPSAANHLIVAGDLIKVSDRSLAKSMVAATVLQKY